MVRLLDCLTVASLSRSRVCSVYSDFDGCKIYIQMPRIRRNVCEDCCTFGHFIAELPVKIMDCTFTPDLYSPKSVRTEYVYRCR